jgi:hypothetical protein
MELGHLLTRFGLTYPEVFSKDNNNNNNNNNNNKTLPSLFLSETGNARRSGV